MLSLCLDIKFPDDNYMSYTVVLGEAFYGHLGILSFIYLKYMEKR